MSIYNIKDFGAIGDGKKVNTESILRAIQECEKNGGGTVICPQGVYLTGSIELRSNITLLIENGCILKATGNYGDYPYIGFYHNEMHETTSIIWAMGCENISICGEGIIDISSQEYYNETIHRSYCDEKNAVLDNKQMNDFIYNKNEKRINQPVFFESCKNICIKNVKIINSTCWTVVFSRSTDITVKNITVDNDLHVQNDDGIHISACRNVKISDCNISCADDCIAVTSITAKEEKNSSINIMNCILRSRSAAVRLGHKVENVIISGLNIYDNNRGIAIFTDDDGFIRNVLIENIILHNHISTSGWWGKGEAIVISATHPGSCIENIMINNIIGEAEGGIIIFGHEHNISSVQIFNVAINIIRTKNAPISGQCIDLRPYLFEKIVDGMLPAIYIKETINTYLCNVKINHNKEMECFERNINLVIE